MNHRQPWHPSFKGSQKRKLHVLTAVGEFVPKRVKAFYVEDEDLVIRLQVLNYADELKRTTFRLSTSKSISLGDARDYLERYKKDPWFTVKE